MDELVLDMQDKMNKSVESLKISLTSLRTGKATPSMLNGVEGVYDKDPRKDATAKFFPVITYEEMLKLNLQIMDTSAIELIKDKDIQIRVFRMEADNFIAAAQGKDVGSICKKGE